jgi:hypothetical protein
MNERIYLATLVASGYAANAHMAETRPGIGPEEIAKMSLAIVDAIREVAEPVTAPALPDAGSQPRLKRIDLDAEL